MEKYSGYLRQKETRTLCQSVLVWPHDAIGILTTFGSEENALGCRHELFCFRMAHTKRLKKRVILVYNKQGNFLFLIATPQKFKCSLRMNW